MIVISGYYGFRNWGDEAILEALCRQLELCGCRRQDLVVLSQDPEFTRRCHGTAARSRTDLKALNELWKKKPILISGGGSLLQDSSSPRTIPYYLGLTEWARRRGCTTVMYAQGVGPVRRRFFRSWVGRAFTAARGATVRDPHSAELVRAWSKGSVSCPVGADPVYWLSDKITGSDRGKGLLLNLRPLARQPFAPQAWVERFKRWSDDGWTISFAALGPGDALLGAELARRWPKLVVLEFAELKQVVETFREYDAALCMRLHGVIFAALGGCLPVGIAYDPKINAAALSLGIAVLPLGEEDRFGRSLPVLWQNREDARRSLAAQVGSLEQSCAVHQQMLAEIIRGTVGERF